MTTKKTTKGQQLKYKDLLQQSQKEKEEQEIAFQVEETEQQLASDILATKRSIVSKQRELTNAKASITFNSKKIVNLQVELEGLEDGLSRLEALKEELF